MLMFAEKTFFLQKYSIKKRAVLEFEFPAGLFTEAMKGLFYLRCYGIIPF